MRLIATAVTLALITGCATQRGNDRHAQHAADQIKMIAVQREAQLKEAQAESATQVALVQALSEVAKSNPDHAPAVTVALAVIGVRGAEATSQDAPVIGLQQQRNEALEWTKALAPTVGNLVSGLGVAAINASVTKNAQDANRAIQINDAQSDVAIVQAVAGLGTAAANNSGITAGGDVYQVQDEGIVDQTQFYDSSTDNIYTAEDSGFINMGTNIHDSEIVYGNEPTTFGDLISYLQGLGSPYTLTVDGEVVAQSTSGSGEPVS